MLVAIIYDLFNLIYLVLMFWVLASWIPVLRENPLYLKLDMLISKILEPLRKVIPPIGGKIDITPIFLFLGLGFLRTILVSLFRN